MPNDFSKAPEFMLALNELISEYSDKVGIIVVIGCMDMALGVIKTELKEYLSRLPSDSDSA